MTTTEPGRAAERLLFDALDALKQGNVHPWVNMFHDDGVMEFPYAPAGGHGRLDGKAAIAEYLKPYPERISIRRVKRRAVYYCGDVMVAEFACESTALPTGNDFEMNYVAIVTMQDGKIKHYRDYWNPLVAVQAFGGLDALLKQASEKAT
jgi:uncharacterized protein